MLTQRSIILLALLIILIILIGLTFFMLNPPEIKNLPVKKLKVGDKVIQVELAQTTLSQMKGLSGRNELEKDWGMLFVFSATSVRTMWMKDMNFGLDVIWIREWKIVKIDEGVYPQGLGQPVVSSEVSADSFLEVNTGFVKDHQIKVGDLVFPLGPYPIVPHQT